MLIDLIILMTAIAFLLWSTNIIIDGAIALSQSAGISTIVIGLIIGIGTSAPELFVAITAGAYGSPSLGVANALGSNIVNISLALSCGAIFASITLNKQTILNQFLILGAATAVLGLLMLDGHLGRYDAIIMLILLPFVLYYISKAILKEEVSSHSDKPLISSSIKVLLGLIALLVASYFTVDSAVHIARKLNISEAIIGLSIIAIGTSLPELLTVFTSLWRKQSGIAIGNILGSNIFNSLGVVAATIWINPFTIDPTLLERDYAVGAALTLLVFLLIFAKPNFTISRWKGIILLTCFFGYMLKLYIDTVAYLD